MHFDFITHYYLSDREPFLSLSELNEESDSLIYNNIIKRHETDPLYNRVYGENYLLARKIAEEKLCQLFIKRGGQPADKVPRYFVLGESKWFESLNPQHEKIQIPIEAFPKEKLSITFPDSLQAMLSKEKPYYEKVYLVEEIQEMLRLYGSPSDNVPESYNRYWEVKPTERFYEVQVWDKNFLRQYF